MVDNPRILVSLGAQKAATTWLSKYLSEHPQCALTPMKEVHYFDYYDFGERDLGLAFIEKTRDTLIRRSELRPELYDSTKYRKAMKFFELRLGAIDLGPPTYEGYEALILGSALRGNKVIGEITPGNGLLSEERLRGIAALDSKPLFVLTMRDPVDRTWSNIRMVAKQDKTIQKFEDLAHAKLAMFLNGKVGGVFMRSDYGTMLSKIDAAIPADRISINFFEEFLKQPQIDAFCDFLGVDRHPASLEKPRNPGVSLKMTDTERRALSAMLRPVYDAVEARMGRLPGRWIQNRDLAA